ncbi:MAG: hypothetical protein OEW87_09815, partial [Flavobacteriaceae bacterium]|nr:hypothetical protein [Flavobacteriaceae bacterium]
MFNENIRIWNGQQFITHLDNKTESFMIIAIHSSRKGRSAGGLRIKTYTSYEEALEDAFKLSEAMTYKFILSGLDFGGAKSVIHVPSVLSNELRNEILINFSRLLNYLAGQYYVGPDIGTSSVDMDFIYNNGCEYVFSRTTNNRGGGSSAIPTAHGILTAIKATCENLFGSKDLRDKKIVVQGVGNVGGLLLELLKNEKANVKFNEVDQKLVQLYVNKGFSFIPTRKLFSTNCDILSPCGVGNILNSHTIPLLNCKAIVGAANNQLEELKNAKELLDKGIFYAPDYVVNLGGAMCITLVESEGYSIEDSLIEMKKVISSNVNEIFSISNKKNKTTV